MATEDFNSWLSSKLESLNLDAEVYCEYVSGIMGDEDMDLDERAQTVKDLLGSAVEDEMPELEALPNELTAKWREKSLAETAAKEAAAQQKREALEKQRQEERRLAKENEEKRKASASAQMTKEERREREKLLNQYAYGDEDIDEEGNITIKATQGGDSVLSGVIGANSNKQRVVEEAAKQRQEAKMAHEAQQKRNKEQQIREKEKKEKKKERTQKKEKRRGCG